MAVRSEDLQSAQQLFREANFVSVQASGVNLMDENLPPQERWSIAKAAILYARAQRVEKSMELVGKNFKRYGVPFIEPTSIGRKRLNMGKRRLVA